MDQGWRHRYARAKAWTAGEFTLPAEANNRAAVFVRWIADKTSSVKGTTGTNDGIALAQIYITGTAKLFDDGTAPVLQSQYLQQVQPMLQPMVRLY